MKNRPIHENLDTSFVNLSALVKYLRRRQFAGQVRIELSGYEADIYLTAENQLKVREYDHIAGRIAEGEEALQRILIRSREPGGIINVYQTVPESETVVEKVEKKEIVIEKTEPVVENPPLIETTENKPLPIETNGANGNGNGSGKPKIEFPFNDHAANGNGKNGNGRKETLKSDETPLTPKSKLPNLPFEFTNKVESRAKQQNLSAEERAMLLNLTGELLGTVDRCLGMAKLEFSTAFQKACAEISADYPFLTTLSYQKGKLAVSEQTNPKFFVAGILEALRRILEKLGANPKFGEVYRYTTQKILTLVHQRKPFYDKFFITKPLEKILGA
jgi:hypothetical protein